MNEVFCTPSSSLRLDTQEKLDIQQPGVFLFYCCFSNDECLILVCTGSKQMRMALPSTPSGSQTGQAWL